MTNSEPLTDYEAKRFTAAAPHFHQLFTLTAAGVTGTHQSYREVADRILAALDIEPHEQDSIESHEQIIAAAEFAKRSAPHSP